MKYILYTFLLLVFGNLQAQLSVDNVFKNPDGSYTGSKVEYTPEQLAKTVLVIPNPLYNPDTPQTVFPSNVIYNKSLPNAGRVQVYNDQIGKWETNNNAGNLGLGSNEYGVLLTTGQTVVALGPNNLGNATIPTITPSPYIEGDDDLQQLSG